MKKNYFFFVFIFCFFGLVLFSPLFSQVNVSNEDVIRSKHNLSSTWPTDVNPNRRAPVTSETEDQVCIFCHTPHGSAGEGPLWNRNFSAELNYKPYQPQINIMTGSTQTGSLDFTKPNSPDKIQPSGYSKLCLSCHDGTIAFGAIRNAAGAGNYDPSAATAFDRIKDLFNTTMGSVGPVGKGEFTGDTRKIGTNLSNDHPISFIFDKNVKNADKELEIPDPQVSWTQELDRDHVRLYPLNFESKADSVDIDKGAVQCTSCHNPHSKEEKFLRAPRYDTKPAGESDQICYSCHPKLGWLNSTHELNNSLFNGSELAYRTRTDTITDAVEADGKTLGAHGCLNCHDPHTVQGADRLHRNGASFQDGNGTPSIENTCFQCHISNSATIPLIGGEKFVVQAPDIKTHFDKRDIPGGSAMPLNKNWASSYSPEATNGIHQPVFVSKETPGKESVLFAPVNSLQVHVECVDCHNPHQVNSKNRVRGMKGITIKGEEIGGDTNGQLPIFTQHDYNDDRSPGGTSQGAAMIDAAKDRYGQGYDPLVYEVCLRCHGDTFDKIMPYKSKTNDTIDANTKHRGHMDNFTFGDLNRKADDGTPIPMPILAQFGASNKRREFDPDTPAQTRNKFDKLLSLLPGMYNTSFHPVAAPGRNATQALFNQLQKAFNLTSAEDLKSLTIMCTDCHNNDAFNNSNDAVYITGSSGGKMKGPITGLNSGESYRRFSDKASGLSTETEGNPDLAQGPHGSKNKRILRARYDTNVYSGIERPSLIQIKERYALCFICHEAEVILGERKVKDATNFGSDDAGETWGGNLHRYHLRLAGAACHECHNNVHSNVEADNTIYGNADGTALHPDESNSDPGDGMADGYSSTHLLNFGPQASGDSYYYPNWAWDSSNKEFRCNLRCHGASMTQCAYSHSLGHTLNMWCAGWQ